MSQFKSSKKGFTLVELVIVIAILAILAAIAIPTVMNVIERANQSSDAANAKTMESALKTQAALDAPTNTLDADVSGDVSVTEAANYIKGEGGIDAAATDPAVATNQFWINLDTLQVKAGDAAPSAAYVVLFNTSGGVGAAL